MPSRLFSNLNVAYNLGSPKAVRVRQYQPHHFIEALCSRKSSSGGVLAEAIRYISNWSYKKIMAGSGSGSIVASVDLMVDTLVLSSGNLSGYVKPGGVFFCVRSHKICRRAKVSIRSGETETHHGGRGCLVFGLKQGFNNSGLLFLRGLSSCRTFSSSCYSDGIVPEASTDGSLSAEHLSSLALSTEQRSPSQSTLKLLSGACYLPHPAKEETGGEDAHFICADEQAIGVADGVGGWADVGVNAGEYARELMSNSVEAIREMPDGDIDPLQVLVRAHATTNAMGSSTACIIVLKNQDLHAINLGDSGFIIVRDGAVIFESPVQQHGFNFTYQLERGTRSDLPSSGQVFRIPVVHGDVVVAGSDGLFDNLCGKEIADIVGDAVKEDLSPHATAQKIATCARIRALDRKHPSPFSIAAQEAGFSYYGGKLDDLTVIVSCISTS